MAQVLAVAGTVGAVVSMAMPGMVVIRPEEECVDEESREASKKDTGARDGEEAAARLVRVPPSCCSDVDGLDQRRRLVGHLLRMRSGAGHVIS